MIFFQISFLENLDFDDIEGRYGYYVYIYNENFNKSQGYVEGKFIAFVRLMMFFFEEKDLDSNDFIDFIVKLDLKLMMLNFFLVDFFEIV